jgi:hypothetical protein
MYPGIGAASSTLTALTLYCVLHVCTSMYLEREERVESPGDRPQPGVLLEVAIEQADVLGSERGGGGG